MRFARRAWQQLVRLWPVLLGVVVLAILAFGIGALLGQLSGIGVSEALSDTYEYTGSRFTGLVSNAGVMLWMATAAICAFAAWITDGSAHGRSRRRFLLASVGVTLMLLLDDYLAVHESADDILAAAVGDDPDRLVKNVLETGIFIVYGCVLLLYLGYFRRLILSTEFVILGISFVAFALSLLVDMAPLSWLTQTTGMSVTFFDLIEEGLKAVGIALYATYYVRTSRMIVRSGRSPDTVEPAVTGG